MPDDVISPREIEGRFTSLEKDMSSVKDDIADIRRETNRRLDRQFKLLLILVGAVLSTAFAIIRNSV